MAERIHVATGEKLRPVTRSDIEGWLHTRDSIAAEMSRLGISEGSAIELILDEALPWSAQAKEHARG